MPLIWTTPDVHPVWQTPVGRNVRYLKERADVQAPIFSITQPSSPVDGQRWRYPGSGFFWEFVWDSTETTYKWKCVGGVPAFSVVDTDETFTSNGAYNDCATVGPDFTLPFAGDYDTYFTSQLYSTGAGIFNMVTGLSVAGATPAAGQIAVGWGGQSGIALSDPQRGGQVLGASAGNLLRMKYQSGTATSHARWRTLKVMPRRVI